MLARFSRESDNEIQSIQDVKKNWQDLTMSLKVLERK